MAVAPTGAGSSPQQPCVAPRDWGPGFRDLPSGAGTSVLPGPACCPDCLGYALPAGPTRLSSGGGTGSQPATRGGAMLRQARFGKDKFSEKHLPRY